LDLKLLQHIGQSRRFSIAADFLRKLVVVVVVTFLEIEIIMEDVLFCFDNLFSLIIKKRDKLDFMVFYLTMYY
jgi:hypothetical protein